MFKKAQQRRDLESDLNSEKATEEADGGAIRSSESDEYDASPSVGAAQKASSDIGEIAADAASKSVDLSATASPEHLTPASAFHRDVSLLCDGCMVRV